MSLWPGLVSGSPPLPGGEGDRYVVGRELGRGSTAKVYLGVDRTLRRSVAIKVLEARETTDAVRVQRFLEEAVVTGALDHPNIVSVYDLGYEPSIGYFYTMGVLRGVTLEQRIDDLRSDRPGVAGAFEHFRRVGVFVEVCRAVAHAHERGVVHSDLKPANVMTSEAGEVTVVDWGLAQLVGPEGDRQARARLHAGTPAYMPPEQVRRAPGAVGPRGDVWSLGVILYELLTLSRPFAGATREALFADIERAAPAPLADHLGAATSDELQQIVTRALSADPMERFPSARELQDAVEQYLHGAREVHRQQELGSEAAEAAWRLIERMDELDDDRAPSDSVVEAAGRAFAHVERGLVGGGRADLLEDAAGELYWRLLPRLHEIAVPEPRRRTVAMLVRLTELALPAVVRSGQARLGAGGRSVDGDAEDPWLRVVRAYCADPLRAEVALELGRLVDRSEFLRQTALFRSLASASLLSVAVACAERSYGAGEVLFREGEPADALYFVVEGRARIERGGAVLAEAVAGDVVGEVSVAVEGARTATAVAAAPTRCLAIGTADFGELVRRDGDIGLALIRVLSMRLAAATEREVSRRGHT